MRTRARRRRRNLVVRRVFATVLRAHIFLIEN